MKSNAALHSARMTADSSGSLVTGIASVWLTYGRVSSEEQAKLGYSIQAQARTCRDRALELGATAVEEFLDEGVPGDIINRPHLNALRERIRRGDVAGVVCYDPDRLARDLAYQLVLAEEIERAGCRIEFIDHDYKNTAEGKLFFQIRGAIAEYERAKITERTSRGKREKALKGLIPGNYRGYGYDLAEGHLHVNSQEAPWVVQIFSWCVNERMGTEMIARRLNDLGLPRDNGSPWSRQRVLYMLQNETYKGNYVIKYSQAGVRKNKFRDADERVRKTLLPESEWLRIPVPALVPAELWEEAQRTMESSPRVPMVGYHPYLLSGIVQCGLCGAFVRGKMHHSGRRKPKRRVPYYVCANHWKPPTSPDPACKLPGVKAETIETAVWLQVESFLDDPDAYVRLARQEASPDAGGWRHELVQVHTELQRINEERQRAVRMAAKGHISEEESDELLNDVNGRLRRLMERKAALEALLGSDKKESDLAARIIAAQKKVDEARESLDQKEKRSVVLDLIEKVVLVPGEIRIIPR